MKIIQISKDVLVVRKEKVFFYLFATGAVIFFCLAIRSFIIHRGTIQENIYYGQAAAAITLLLFALPFSGSSEFVFHRGQRLVKWRKTTIFGTRSGSIDFDSITAIVAQSLVDHDNNRSARVAIITTTGELPLTRSYSGNVSQTTRIAEKLNQWVLGLEPDLLKKSIKVALTEGRRAEAAISLRRAYGFSMNEASDILNNPGKIDALPPANATADIDLHSGDKELVMGIAALIMLVCGPMFLFFGIYGLYKSLGSTNWPQAEAVVMKSGLHREIEDDEFYFSLEYSYPVNGIEYQSNVLYFRSPQKESYPVIPKIYLKDSEVVRPGDYQPGRTITVYYNPKEPQTAVVIPGVSGTTWAALIFGILCSLIYLYLARKDLQRREGRHGGG